MPVLTYSGKVMLIVMFSLALPIFLVYSWRDGWFNIFKVVHRLLCVKNKVEEKVNPYDPETRGISSELLARKMERESNHIENHPLGPKPKKKRKHKNPTR
jgi:hypothetical protein